VKTNGQTDSTDFTTFFCRSCNNCTNLQPTTVKSNHDSYTPLMLTQMQQSAMSLQVAKLKFLSRNKYNVQIVNTHANGRDSSYWLQSTPSAFLTLAGGELLEVHPDNSLPYALTLLVGCQEEHPNCKKIEWWGVGVVICLEQGANCLHMVQLMPLPSQNPIFSCQTGFTVLVPRLSWKQAVKRV